MHSTDAVIEARRQAEVCNACRYCEGYCAVFPALERRRAFTNSDIAYLANLCHNCKGCYYACQYAPPHAFAINFPQVLAEVRTETYAAYAWPRAFAGVFERNGVIVSLAAAIIVTVVLVGVGWLQDPDVIFGVHTQPGAFYAVIPWSVMGGLSAAVFLYSMLALAIGFWNFWRDTGGKSTEFTELKPLVQMTSDVLSLRHLGGGGHGCNDKDESFSQLRRWLHHATFYGFMLCFASTGTAWFYDTFLNWMAPYPVTSLPVVLGCVGGVGLIIGTAGLFWLKLVSDQAPTSRKLLGADVALLMLLGTISFSGFLLLGLRATTAMGTLLALHVGLVLAFFVVIPYSKFVHGVYRAAALLRNRLELQAIDARTNPVKAASKNQAREDYSAAAK